MSTTTSFKSPHRTSIWLYVLFFLGAQAILLLFLLYEKDQNEIRHGANQIERLESEYRAVFSSYGYLARLVFDEIINTPVILDMLREAADTDETRRQALRQALYTKLLPTYQNLRKNDFRQFHFHLADGTSFLRMHLPEAYGDNLFEVRASVRVANQEQRAVAGFEEGRHYHAFRYVFPLFHQNQHLGSVEVSVPFYSLRKGLIDSFLAEYFFILDTTVAEQKLFPGRMAMYITSNLSPAFLMEKADLEERPYDRHSKHLGKQTVIEINAGLKDRAAPLLAQRSKPFSLSASAGDKDYAVTFLPIRNFENTPIGYLISYGENADLGALRTSYSATYILATGLILMLILLYRWSTRRIVGQLAFQQNLIDSIPVPIYFKDIRGTYLGCNISYATLLKKSGREIIGRSAAQLFGTKEALREEDRDGAILPDGGTQRFEERIDMGNGRFQDFIVEKTDFRDGKGRVAGLIGVHVDITEKNLAEKAIRENEARFRELFNHMSSGVAIYQAANEQGSDYIFVDFNAAAEKIDDITKEEVLGRRLTELYPGIREFGLVDILQRVWQSGKAEYLPASFYRDHRLQGWRNNYVYKLPSGEVVAIYDDITAQKMAEEEIKNHNEFLVTILESLPYPFYVIDAHDYIIIQANSKARDAGPCKGSTCHALTHCRDTPCDGSDHLCPLQEVKRTKQAVVVEHIHKDLEGRDQHVEVHGYPILGKNGEVERMIEYSIDITQRKKRDQEKEQLIAKLQESIEKVKLLSGFLPICASCKMIRDDTGYWKRIEAYISEHSEAEFTHSICPDCSKRLYPEIHQD